MHSPEETDKDNRIWPAEIAFVSTAVGSRYYIKFVVYIRPECVYSYTYSYNNMCLLLYIYRTSILSLLLLLLNDDICYFTVAGIEWLFTMN